MHPRNLILGTIGSGVLLGMAGGVWVNTTPKPPPQPEWRRIAHSDGAAGASSQFVDSGPEDLSPASDLDRLPTWKRRALLQANAEVGPSDAAYSPDTAFVEVADASEPMSEAGAPVAPDDGKSAAAAQDADAAQDAGDAGRAAMSPVSRQDIGAQQLQPARDDAGSQQSLAGQDGNPQQ